MTNRDTTSKCFTAYSLWVGVTIRGDDNGGRAVVQLYGDGLDVSHDYTMGGGEVIHDGGFLLEVNGDTEARVLADALEWAGQELRRQLRPQASEAASDLRGSGQEASA
jgi:hypothetical protein